MGAANVTVHIRESLSVETLVPSKGGPPEAFFILRAGGAGGPLSVYLRGDGPAAVAEARALSAALLEAAAELERLLLAAAEGAPS